jgi:hypothetical protein
MTAAIRDKGVCNLATPDVKIACDVERATGYLWMVRLDFPHCAAQVWYQPSGWLPVVYYGMQDNMPKENLVGFDAVTHDGRFKVAAVVWDRNAENGGTLPGNTAIIIDLGAIPPVF